MAIKNKLITKSARDVLSGKWLNAVGAFFVVELVNGIGGPLGLIVNGPMRLGAASFSLNIVRNKKTEFSQIFDGFNNFTESLVAFLLMTVYVLLWSLLLIIPGIITAISYSQTFFLLADNKKLSGVEALRKSKLMMEGYKAKYFYLLLRFTGWFLLSILTLGIGLLWLIPYIRVSLACFYEDLRPVKK